MRGISFSSSPWRHRAGAVSPRAHPGPAALARRRLPAPPKPWKATRERCDAARRLAENGSLALLLDVGGEEAVNSQRWPTSVSEDARVEHRANQGGRLRRTGGATQGPPRGAGRSARKAVVPPSLEVNGVGYRCQRSADSMAQFVVRPCFACDTVSAQRMRGIGRLLATGTTLEEADSLRNDELCVAGFLFSDACVSRGAPLCRTTGAIFREDPRVTLTRGRRGLASCISSGHWHEAGRVSQAMY